MKKRILLFALIAALLLCAGCGAQTVPETTAPTEAEQEAAPQTAQAWVQTLGSRLPFDDEMSDTDQAAAIYGIFSEDGYTGDCAMRISTMATPEEIAVFRTDAAFDAAALCALAQARLAQQKSSYESYAPAEVPKLESALVRVCGDYVIVCVCADNALASQILDGYGAVESV